MTSWHLTVGGHDWSVHDRDDEPGAYDFRWLTGPHPYGFSMGSSDRSPMAEADMRRYIADFQAQIDPDTGYLT
jgi:hypothetical protein